MAEILFKNKQRHKENEENERNLQGLQAQETFGKTPYSTLPMHDKSIDQAKSQTSVNKSADKEDENASHVVVMSHHNTHPSPLKANE